MALGTSEVKEPLLIEVQIQNCGYSSKGLKFINLGATKRHMVLRLCYKMKRMIMSPPNSSSMSKHMHFQQNRRLMWPWNALCSHTQTCYKLFSIDEKISFLIFLFPI
ncbi:hypothetical protein LXL04_029420 [Taraxacum kok-saghyz]